MALVEAPDAADSKRRVLATPSVLNARYGILDAYGAIALAVEELFRDCVALVSSFGAVSSSLRLEFPTPPAP